MNKKQLFTAIMICLLAVLAYIGYKLIPPQPIMPVHSGCLGKDEIAVRDKTKDYDDIVIRNKDSDTEVRRFSLPSSTLAVTALEECDVKIVLGNQYDYLSVHQPVYRLLPGGSIEQWKYSYDGTLKRNFTIIDNPLQKYPEFLAITFDPKEKYVSEVRNVESPYLVEIYALENGTKLFSTRETMFWKASAGSTEWRNENGRDVFMIYLQDGQGGAQNAIIDTETWTMTRTF